MHYHCGLTQRSHVRPFTLAIGAATQAFTQSVSWEPDPDHGVDVLRASMQLVKQPAPCALDQACEVDYYPADVFIAAPSHQTQRYFGDQRTFFGGIDGTGRLGDGVARCVGRAGAVARYPHLVCPAAVLQANAPSTELPPTPALSQPATLTLATDNITVAPGTPPTTLRFAFGWARPGDSVGAMVQAYLAPTASSDAQVQHSAEAGTTSSSGDSTSSTAASAWHASTAGAGITGGGGSGTGCAGGDAWFVCGDGGGRVLDRELRWRSASLQATAVYDDFFGTHVVPQGSAYLYLHGLDGAPRDLVSECATM